MSTVPAEIAGVGSTSQKLRVSPGFDPMKAGIEPDEYFVLSRIDGSQSLRDVLLATGLPVERCIAIVTRLRALGALLLPGEQSARVAASPSTSPAAGARAHGTAATSGRVTGPSGRMAAGSKPVPSTAGGLRRGADASQPAAAVEPAPLELAHDLRLANPTRDELAALSEDTVLPDPVRRRVLSIQRLIERNDPHAILGVPPGADARTLKRAYFLLSKEVHPDRYYGKKLGSFADRMALVFEATSRAYATLTSPRARGSAAHMMRAPAQDQPQTPQEYAAELFERACNLEVSGDALEAMKLFAAAVRVDPQTRYLRRAASCALAADQPKSAVEYAKKAQLQAPNDVSCARLLAAAFRAAGKLSDAEEVLIMAMALKSENDVLTSELRNDLAEVRRLLAAVT